MRDGDEEWVDEVFELESDARAEKSAREVVNTGLLYRVDYFHTKGSTKSKPYYYFVHYTLLGHSGLAAAGQRLVQRQRAICTPEDFDNFYEFVRDDVLKDRPGFNGAVIITNFVLLHRE